MMGNVYFELYSVQWDTNILTKSYNWNANNILLITEIIFKEVT